ncbi:uncharacterized protein LOC133923891 [Phragmites australis]|uniref:uncharacterized protein LOC133923891 n=1 Tax=Phragmites australis TaxID=29695 RepID=UPI002D77FF86|nr:uncharacterized protein LOC133923891 [Phragmites australis]
MSSPPAPGASTRKRRRTSDPGPRWASLPEDLVGVVASRLLAGDLLDYVRFRAVCTSWRSGTASPRGRGVADPRFHPRRWMMLPEGHCLYPGHPDLRGYVRFLNLDTGTLVRVRIPLLGDHCAIDSVDGLLLLLRDPDQEGAVRLLHPFTGDIAELPPLGTLLPQLGSRLLSCPAPYRIRSLASVVCASVSCNAGSMTIMLALHEVNRVAFATSLDRQWTLSSWECPIHYPPLSFQGKLYMVHTPRLCGKKIHQVLQIDPPVQDGAGAGLSLRQPKLIATIPAHKLVDPAGLVEYGSEILVLGHNDLSAVQILVCKLADLVLQRFIPIKSIGGNTLFLEERNISVSSKVLTTVKGDNVVYIHSGPPYLAQYHLSTGSLSPAIDNYCRLYGRAPGPSSLVHCIFSCCIRNRWSRGLIFRRNAQSWSVQDEEQVQ